MNKRTAQHAEMATIARVGLDTPKKHVQLHDVNAAGQSVLRKQLPREQMPALFANPPSCLSGLEACSSSHNRNRELISPGLKIMVAFFFSPYRNNRSGKNDANDAEAIP